MREALKINIRTMEGFQHVLKALAEAGVFAVEMTVLPEDVQDIEKFLSACNHMSVFVLQTRAIEDPTE